MGWYLNPFLTSFRAQVNKTFPRRGKGSDGTLGDPAHAARVSEHNRDTDGSVDAWDCDVNLHGSVVPTGTADEITAMRWVLKEFEKQPQAQLWIFRGQIANRDIGPWRVRPYTGPNKHDHHAHLQSRQAKENQTYKGELVLPATNRTGDDMPLDATDQTRIRTIVREELNSFGDREPLSTLFARSGENRTRVADVQARLTGIAGAVAAIVPQDIDEDALGAAIASRLPDDSDDISADELKAALVGAFREILDPPAVA